LQLAPPPQSPPSTQALPAPPTALPLALPLALLASSARLLTSCKRRAPFAPSHETISFSIDNIVGLSAFKFDVHDVVWGGWNEGRMESKVTDG
jgi:hypothetical protein